MYNQLVGTAQSIPMRILSCIPLIALLLTACTPAENRIARVTSIPRVEGALLPTATMASATNAGESNPTDTGETILAPTPMPLDNNLAQGEARQIAAATDSAFQPTPRSRVDITDEPFTLTFDEFYDGYNLRTGLQLSDLLVSLDGHEVIMEGYMAPPLKPELDFFVLTRIRLAFCPFCTTAADWPDDIALVYMNDDTTTATLNPVRVTGRIEVGTSVDQETGMVSLVRIYADTLEIIE